MTRFSELVSAISPTLYVELALVLFLVTYVVVVIRDGGRRGRHAEAALLPLAADDVPLRQELP